MMAGVIGRMLEQHKILRTQQISAMNSRDSGCSLIITLAALPRAAEGCARLRAEECGRKRHRAGVGGGVWQSAAQSGSGRWCAPECRR